MQQVPDDVGSLWCGLIPPSSHAAAGRGRVRTGSGRPWLDEGMRFGMFVPQGWRMDLVGIEPAQQWEVMVNLAKHADDGDVFESIWVYDHFHTVPQPSGEATHEAWSLMAALRRRDEPGPPRPDVHVHGLPQPRLPREGRRDRRRHLRRPHRDGHRRRLVRARVARLRLRLPQGRRPARRAPRGRPDLPRHVDQGLGDARREVLPGRRRDLRPAAAAGHAPPGQRPQRHPDVDRRRRREGDAEDRGAVRRLHELRRQPRGLRPQERDPRGPLRRPRPRLRRRSSARPTTTSSSARPSPTSRTVSSSTASCSARAASPTTRPRQPSTTCASSPRSARPTRSSRCSRTWRRAA